MFDSAASPPGARFVPLPFLGRHDPISPSDADALAGAPRFASVRALRKAFGSAPCGRSGRSLSASDELLGAIRARRTVSLHLSL